MAKQPWEGPLERVDENIWRIPKSYKEGMRVPGVIFASDVLLETIRQDKAPEQVANTAFLPGVVGHAMAMPDIHWGYGFPIGGVVATDMDAGGVVSPGGVGYDINCGVRLLRTNLVLSDVKPRKRDLVTALFSKIPAGVGSKGRIRLDEEEERRVLRDGTAWAVQRGFGTEMDIEHTEAGGRLDGARPETVSNKAMKRGSHQVGTLGSGNHFIEVQVVDEVFDKEAAAVFGIEEGAVAVMIHTGSRGFGHQVCDDTIRRFRGLTGRLKIELPDMQLCCAPCDSKEGREYMAAMACAANFAWANRQVLTHIVRELFESFFGRSARDLGMDLVYDVAHNIAKVENHQVQRKTLRLCVHRKGATRAFPPGHEELPDVYHDTGQPVIIPGDMGTESYLLRGNARAMELTFGSTCHGAGRAMGRREAIRHAGRRSISREMEEMGILVRSAGRETLAEEASFAYKDISQVVDVVDAVGISTKVARLRPLVVVKG